MKSTEVHFRDAELWNKSGTTYTRGKAYLSEELLAGTRLSVAFSRERGFDNFASLLRRLNGFFAVVHEVDGEFFLAVDHVRSFPLFYGIAENAFYVSDDPHWIQRKIGAQGIDELSASEFLLAGYVTCSDTLSPRVKQLMAGEALTMQFTEKPVVTSFQYYEHARGIPFSDTREQLLVKLDETLIGPFERLIRMAGGRTIVVPLSGGCDSRLIPLMLTRLGYDNVVAFSYGREGNEESRLSRRVASSLGIPWEFVPYSKDSWRRWHHSAEWEAYCQYADGLSSVPYVQDWPAVLELREKQLIPKDSIFVPGHLASHMLRYPGYPTAWANPGMITESEVFTSICQAFYIWRDWSRLSTKLKLRLFEKMNSVLGTRPSYTTEQATEAFERWWWQGYEAKYIINSVRVYGYWGYDWWLPLWDLELARFWNRVPIVHRLEKNLQRAHLQRAEASMSMPNITQHGTRSRNFSLILKSLHKSRLYRPSLWFFGLMQYERHTMGWYGILPRKPFAFLYYWNPDIYYYLALETLQRSFPEWRQNQTLNKLSNSRENYKYDG